LEPSRIFVADVQIGVGMRAEEQGEIGLIRSLE